MSRGYSDAINHAFAFAAVHHEGQKRKGTRLPYLTHLANVALILGRYSRDEETIIAAILHDVVEDCKAHGREEHCNAIERKFGGAVLADVLSVTKPEADGDGRPLRPAEMKSGYIRQVVKGSHRAKWVCAADKLHNASSIISELDRRPPDEVWQLFKLPKGETAAFYRQVFEALRESGFDEPIMTELEETVIVLERRAQVLMPTGGS